MASGKHSKGKHSVPKGSKREFEFPRGPQEPGADEKAEVPEEIAKTAAGKMQTAEHGRDEAPAGEAATAEVLDDWVHGQDVAGNASDAPAKARRRRRRVAIVVAVVVVLVLAGAAVLARGFAPASTPSQAVAAALDAVKARDFETFDSLYAGDGDALESQLRDAFASGAGLGTESELESRLNDEQKRALSQLVGKVTDFDYTIDSESEDGDAATVRVTITTYDFGSFAQNVLGSYIADGLAAFSKGDLESDADAATRFASAIEEHMGELGGKEKSAQTDFALERSDDGTWKLSELTSENLDALTGGLLSTTTEMARQLADSASQ